MRIIPVTLRFANKLEKAALDAVHRASSITHGTGAFHQRPNSFRAAQHRLMQKRERTLHHHTFVNLSHNILQLLKSK